jgi:DNA-binding GntR family transcriptional regulator
MSDRAIEAGGLLPAASVSRREAVVREIRRAIIIGALKPGERITEARLTAFLNVSRPTVREAMNQLARDGLLIQEPYRGLRVAALGADQIRAVARARMSLDLLAVTEILADSSGRRLALLDAAWREYEQADGVDPLEQHQAHLAFHRGIWAASENFLLIQLWPVTEAHITIALAQDQLTRHDPARARRIHARLVEAVHAGDRSEIERAFAEHTLESAEELVGLSGQREVAELPACR